MSKISEAQEQSSKHRNGLKGSPDILTAPRDFDVEQEMLSLYQAIESLLPRRPKKLIQFIGAREGEGTSTLAREFARVAAMRICKSVLLLDGDRFQPSHHLFFPISPDLGWVEVVKEGREFERAFCQVKDTNLFISPSSNSSSYTPEIFDSCTITDFWKMLRSRFDFTIIDCCPLTKSPDGLAIAPKVDGIVLVVEAEKTKWTVAESVKDKLTKVGGNVLGIVLNKRRYHIPQFIYKHL